LYDVFIYTGPSPVNTAFFGLSELFHPKRAVKERLREHKQQGIV